MLNFYFPQTNESIKAKNIVEANKIQARRARKAARKAAKDWSKNKTPITVTKTTTPSKPSKKMVKLSQSNTPSK